MPTMSCQLQHHQLHQCLCQSINKTLPENRRDFKIFFSYLTSIRCAVNEGSHCAEAACQILQGYMLGYTIPLKNNEFEVLSTSTLFKAIPTMVYHCINDNPPVITGPKLKYLKVRVKDLLMIKKRTSMSLDKFFLLVF